QRRIDSGERVVVGVNRHRSDGEDAIPTLRIDPRLERAQIERLNAVRARRDRDAVEASLARLRDPAAGETNVMDALLEATRAHASEGEIVQALQAVWGRYREAPAF